MGKPSQLTKEPPPPDHTIPSETDFSRCESWEVEDQESAKGLLSEYADVFLRHDLDLGCTSLVKHKIKLKLGLQPFKEIL